METLYQEFQISLTEKINRIIYTLMNLKFIGERIPSEWYARTGLKRGIGVIAVILSIIKDIIFKGYYFALVIFTPIVIFGATVSDDNFYIKDWSDMIIWVFFFMNCMIGSFFASKIFETDEKDYMLLHLLRVNPKKHFLYKCFASHLSQTVYYTIFMLIAVSVMGSIPAWRVFRFMVIYLSFRFIGEAANLKLNLKFGIPFTDKNKTVSRLYYIYMTIMLIVAYVMYPVVYFLSGVKKFADTPVMPIDKILSFPVLYIAIILFGVFCAMYIVRCDKYAFIAGKAANYSVIQAKTAEVENVGKEVYEVKEDDISDEEMKSHMFMDKSGYEYLNALFFERHKRLVGKHVRNKAIIAGGAFGAVAVALIIIDIFASHEFRVKTYDEVWSAVNQLITVLIFIMYAASSGKNLTKAMFYNCDYSLLKYGYYRTKEAILTNFRIRLRYMVKAEMPMVLVISAGIVIDTLLLGKISEWVQMLSIIFCVALLSIFYSVVYLCMYYIFQPYTEEGAVTGFGYNFCSGAIYMVSYLCLQIQTVPSYFAWVVLGITIAGLIISYFIAYLVAPKHFVLK